MYGILRLVLSSVYCGAAPSALCVTGPCRGQRIVYELALQELFIAYSGYGGELFLNVDVSCDMWTHLASASAKSDTLMFSDAHAFEHECNAETLFCSALNRRGTELLP